MSKKCYIVVENVKLLLRDNKELKEEIEAKVRDFYGISLNKDKEKKEKK